MDAPVTTVVGSCLSPYVRKVPVCLAVKGVDYRIDPIVPFYGSDEFARISPVRRVPVSIDDEPVLRKAREEEIPQALDCLEGEPPTAGRLFEDLCVADIPIASFFRNAAFSRYAVDAQRWPKTAAFVARVLEHPAFARLRPFEELSLRTPIPKHRAVLAEAGAPVSERTLETATPRRGVTTT